MISNNIIYKLKIEASINLESSFKFSACFIQNNKIISNIYKNNYNYHAEENVIVKYINNLKKNKRTNLIVIRLNGDNELCNARPCFHCLQLIKKNNIKKVYYSDINDSIIQENVNNMISVHITRLYSSCIHIEKLLKNILPTRVNTYNLNNFIKYNLNKNSILYEYIISNNINYILIKDSKSNIIKKIEIY